MRRKNSSLLISRRSLFPLLGGAVVASLPYGRFGRGLAAEGGKGSGTPPGALKRFDAPALIRDLADLPARQARLDREWHENARGWTEQAILGDPWGSLFASNLDSYFNPLHTDLSDAIVYQISWPAFPNRVAYYFDDLTQDEKWEFADTGTVGGVGPTILTDGVECGFLEGKPGTLERISFPPYGYRGWLDEYCEMAVATRPIRPARTDRRHLRGAGILVYAVADRPRTGA